MNPQPGKSLAARGATDGPSWSLMGPRSGVINVEPQAAPRALASPQTRQMQATYLQLGIGRANVDMGEPSHQRIVLLRSVLGHLQSHQYRTLARHALAHREQGPCQAAYSRQAIVWPRFGVIGDSPHSTWTSSWAHSSKGGSGPRRSTTRAVSKLLVSCGMCSGMIVLGSSGILAMDAPCRSWAPNHVFSILGCHQTMSLRGCGAHCWLRSPLLRGWQGPPNLCLPHAARAHRRTPSPEP